MKQGILGPCIVGKDTHALSEPAFISVLEVLIANGIQVIVKKIMALPQPQRFPTPFCATTAATVC